MKIFIALIISLLLNSIPVVDSSFSQMDALTDVCDSSFIISTLTKAERLTTVVKKKSAFIAKALFQLSHPFKLLNIESNPFFSNQSLYTSFFNVQLFPIPPPSII